MVRSWFGTQIADGAHFERSSSVQRLVTSSEQKPALDTQKPLFLQPVAASIQPSLMSPGWLKVQGWSTSVEQTPKLLNSGSSYQRWTVACEPIQAPDSGLSGRAPGPGPKNLMYLGATFSRFTGPDTWGTYMPPPSGEALMAWMRSVTSLGAKVPSS